MAFLYWSVFNELEYYTDFIQVASTRYYWYCTDTYWMYKDSLIKKVIEREEQVIKLHQGDDRLGVLRNGMQQEDKSPIVRVCTEDMLWNLAWTQIAGSVVTRQSLTNPESQAVKAINAMAEGMLPHGFLCLSGLSVSDNILEAVSNVPKVCDLGISVW